MTMKLSLCFCPPFMFTHFCLYLFVHVSLPDQPKAMLTELCLASDEFDHFAVQTHNSITFCLKELRVRQRTN